MASSSTGPRSTNWLVQAYLSKTLHEINLPHKHVTVSVQPFRDAPARVVKSFRVRRVVSPFEFILEYVLDGQEYYYRDWFPKMQTEYASEEKRKALKATEDMMEPITCLVHHNPEDKKFHRVRIHFVDKKNEKATVFYLDLWKMQEAKFSDLYRMEPYYARFVAPLYRCYLYDILPKSEPKASNTSSAVLWSADACSYFKDAVLRKDKTYEGIIMTRSDSVVTRGLPDFYQNVGIVLVEHQNELPSKADYKGCTINAQMVDAGFAVPIGIFGCCRHSLTDVVSPISAPLPRGTSLLPLQVASRLCQVKLAFVEGPGRVFVHLTKHLKWMKDMTARIGAEVASKEPLSEDKIEVGLIVASHVIDPDDDQRSIWSRGVVQGKAKKGNKFKIYLLDYGSDVSLTPIFLRILPDEFHSIPCFAIRTHLDLPTCIPRNGQFWTPDASVNYRQQLFGSETRGEEGVFYIYRSPTSNIVQLEDISQSVNYNLQEKRWIPATLVKPREKCATVSKEHPLLKSLFVSVGVELFYELAVDHSCFWFFKGSAELLKEWGALKSEAELRTLRPEYTGTNSKKMIHQKIFDQKMM